MVRTPDDRYLIEAFNRLRHCSMSYFRKFIESLAREFYEQGLQDAEKGGEVMDAYVVDTDRFLERVEGELGREAAEAVYGMIESLDGV